MQCQQVRNHQTEKNQRNRNHVEAEESVERRVTHDEITANQQGQVRADKRNGGEQVHDHLGTPVRHLAPRQQIPHERFRHQRQEDRAPKQPDQFTRFAVVAVHEPTEHVQINDEEERGCTVECI